MIRFVKGALKFEQKFGLHGADLYHKMWALHIHI